VERGRGDRGKKKLRGRKTLKTREKHGEVGRKEKSLPEVLGEVGEVGLKSNRCDKKGPQETGTG